MKSIILFFCTVKLFAFDQSHSKLNEVLVKYVTMAEHSSTVNYRDMKKDRRNLDEYLNSVSAIVKADFDKFSNNQKLVLHINAYNAFTIKFILDNYPLKSIKEIGAGFLPSALNNPWKKLSFQYLGKKTSLSQLEHEIIRKDFNEPRIHFAINCASIGCPALANEAYTAEKLEKQLQKSTSMFMNDRSRNYYDTKKKRLFVSKIFDWFRSDFQKRYGSVKQFALPYLIANLNEVKALAENRKVKVDHTEYNWNLNE